MQKNILFCLFLIYFFTFSQSEKKNFFTISGFVSDSITGASLKGVHVYLDSLDIGATTNDDGFYSLILPVDDIQINFSFIGYDNYRKNLKIHSDLTFNVFLSSSSKVINEVLLIDRKSQLHSVESSVITIPIAKIKSIPFALKI